MSNIPLEKQRLQIDPIEQIERKIAQGTIVPGDELLHAIERSQSHQLDHRLRDIVRKSSISAVKRRGRPSNCKGREDFALAQLDARYPALLREYDKLTESYLKAYVPLASLLIKGPLTEKQLIFSFSTLVPQDHRGIRQVATKILRRHNDRQLSKPSPVYTPVHLP
jgi:hypothetical protein